MSNVQHDCADKGFQVTKDVFLSYRRETGFKTARIIRDYLEGKGIHVFMDLSEQHPGQFDVRLFAAIRECKYFVLILSQDSLNRCVAKDDWLRMEICTAREAKKTIVPVMLDGFSWPVEIHDELPEEIRTLKNEESVVESQQYFDSTLTRIVERMEGLRLRANVLQIVQNHSPAATTERYFQEHLLDISMVERVDMAFHAGSLWIASVQMNGLLRKMLDHGVKVRVLLNEPKTAEQIGQHMRMKGVRYIKFSESVKDWEALKNEYPEQIEIRLSDIILLRRYYSFTMCDKRLDTVNVKHYIYANADVEANHQSVFDMNSVYFELYRREFEYVWGRSDEIGKN